MSAEHGEYKGHPTLTLRDDNEPKRFITFGMTKAKLILEHWDAIRQFVQDHEAKRKEGPQF